MLNQILITIWAAGAKYKPTLYFLRIGHPRFTRADVANQRLRIE